MSTFTAQPLSVTVVMRPLESFLVPSLNALLSALALPFTLDDPTELTPSLLLAVFESLIGARLPIPQSVRQSRTRDAKSRAMLVLLGVLECDVLRGGTASSTESLSVDDSALVGAGGVSVDGWVDEIGLGEVDPERLADGGWDETIFVGELLCWLARRKGILPRTKSSNRSSHRSLYSNQHSYGEGDGDFSASLLLRPSQSQTTRSSSPNLSIDDRDPDIDLDTSALSHITDVPRHPLVHSPEPSFSVSPTTGTDLSIRAPSISSRTSVSNVHDDPDDLQEASQDTVEIHPLRMMRDAEEDDDQPPTFHPRCIHELDDPSYIRALAAPSSSFDPSMSHEYNDADQQDMDDLYAPPTPTPRRVRLSGWIEHVDSTAELTHFAASRSHSHSRSRPSHLTFSPPGHSQSYNPALTTVNQSSRSTPPSRHGSGKPCTPRHISPPPSPSPPPPPLVRTTHRIRSHPPSPPSPSHSEAPFDVSFSTLNNTSTPAKPRRQSGRVVALGDTRHSQSYTSFVSPASARDAVPVLSTGRRNAIGSPPGASPGPVGSTATTNTLLTERARLLTELAALKRARALSGAGADRGSSSGVVSHRVGVGV